MRFILFILFCVLHFSCQPADKKPYNKDIDPAHNSQNALDWSGLYTGTLACADCPGVQTMLFLDDQNMQYTLTRFYEDRSNHPEIEKGSFEWDSSGAHIRLLGAAKKEGAYAWKVMEGKLMQLDREEKAINTQIQEAYTLKKSTNPLFDKYWIAEDHRLEMDQPAWFRLQQESTNKVFGFAGCNRFFGSWEVQHETQNLSFTKLASTMMACDHLTSEQQYLADMENTCSYEVNAHGQLLLKDKKGKELLRFN